MDEFSQGGFNGGAQTGGQETATNPAAGAGAGTGGIQTGAQPAPNSNLGPGTNGVAAQAVEYQPFNVPQDWGGIDDESQKEVATLAKEMNLSQAQAQKWVDAGARVYSDGMEAVRLEVMKKFNEWESSSKADPEIQPFLDNNGRLPKVSELINRAMGPDDGKAFHDMAAETGIGANPLFIKFCLRMTRLMGEAPFVGGSVGGRGTPSVEQQASLLFPNM